MTDVASAPTPTLAAGARRRRHPLLRFVIGRVIAAVLTLLAVSVLIFIGTQVVPGDAASTLLGKSASPAAVQELRAELGLDRSAPVRYLDWLGGIVTGDFGDSSVAVAQGSPDPSIWGQTRGRLANTTVLALVTIALLVPLSLLLGVIAAVRAGRLADQVISTATLVMVAVPEFVVGTLLIIVFFAMADLLPPVSIVPPGESALAHPDLLVMPVLTLLLTSLAWTTRFVRVGTIDVLEAGYVQMARLHGLGESLVLRRYALRNAIAPTVQIFAVCFQFLFGGVIVVEVIFGYPGLGKGLVDAVLAHDTTAVQSLAVMLGAIYISINILADLAVVLIVPKLRTQM